MNEHMDAKTFRRTFCAEPFEAKKHGEPDVGRISLWLRFPRETHPNASSPGAWRRKAKAKKAQKEDAWATAKQAMGLARPWKAATVSITYFTSAAKCDSDNIVAWGKSAFDGMQGVVIENDSGFTFLPVKIVRVKRNDPLRGLVQLVITKTAPLSQHIEVKG